MTTSPPYLFHQSQAPAVPSVHSRPGPQPVPSPNNAFSRYYTGTWAFFITCRHQLYPLYKANRPPSPPEVKEALPALTAVAQAMCLSLLSPHGVEADDAIGTLAARAVQEVRRCSLRMKPPFCST